MVNDLKQCNASNAIDVTASLFKVKLDIYVYISLVRRCNRICHTYKSIIKAKLTIINKLIRFQKTLVYILNL